MSAEIAKASFGIREADIMFLEPWQCKRLYIGVNPEL